MFKQFVARTIATCKRKRVYEYSVKASGL